MTSRNMKVNAAIHYRENMLLFIIAAHIVVGVMGDNTYTHKMTLHPKYQMWWKFDDKNITVKLKVNTTGWIGWGISQNGKMKGADMLIGWVDSNGGNHFNDRHGLGYYLPSIDDHEDYERIEMFEADDCTTIVFTRKIELSNEQDIKITQDTMRILYAWNDVDPVDNNDIRMHSTRGARSVYLLDVGDQKKIPLPKYYKTFDVRMDEFKVPTNDTTYWCNTYKLPDMGEKKQHLIQVDIVITPGNEDVVHHMILYKCMHLNEDELNKQHECYTPNMPDSCTNIAIHSWAIGGSSFYYHAKSGLPLNDPNDVNGVKYLLLEIHYDNPKLRSGIVDSSGLRLYYTGELRRYDTAVLTVGILPKLSKGRYSQIIPQQQKSFKTYGYCTSKCMDSGGQKPMIYAAFLHAHTHATAIVVRLVNEATGKTVKTIAEDLNYDFNFQEVRYLKEPIKIVPGHRIDVECTYNTLGVQKPVTSGLGTNEEMCLAFLFVYPKVNMTTCYSWSSAFYTWGTKNLGWVVQNGKIASPVVVGKTNYNAVSVFSPLLNKDLWAGNEARIKSFEQSGADEPYRLFCTFSNGSLYWKHYDHNLQKDVAKGSSSDVTYSLLVFLPILLTSLLCQMYY